MALKDDFDDLNAFLDEVKMFNARFPHQEELTLERSCLKVCSEAGELADTILRESLFGNREEEWADTLFALLHHAIIAKYDISRACELVAKKNRKKCS